ncbi:MAG: UDP-N-acetylmuramoyl-tripeptide--D-alanyl-D-alanine ligase [Burkholderiaceae bacterium]|nr:UDP-N-acetylmuramoyl-tripeptide--D-alanyl-D-alanine ligase [Burkholderiaceae bacterium]
MNGNLSSIQAWIAGSRRAGDAAFSGISTDSRNVQPGNLFVALRGERFDAHDFLNDVVSHGAAAVVVERIPPGLQVPALVVPDTREALGEIARHWRRQFVLPVIGVTGSNGKTTVKEMIASILRQTFGEEQCLATSGNLNNDIGVPLTLLRLNGQHRAAVVEMGMNHVGEIAQLASIAQPTVGLVNNAQREHQEFMHSVEAVARENGAVLTTLPAGGVAVFPVDDDFTPVWRELAASGGKRRVVSFGLCAEADVRGDYQLNDFGSEVMLHIGGDSREIKLQAAGLHNVRNALAAAACCHAIGIGPEKIALGLTAFAPVNGRMQRKLAKNGVTVIDDTYNANPDSVRAAIDVLARAAAPRLLVLGDMGEVGQEGQKFHEEIGAYARQAGIERFFALGDLARDAASAFGMNAVHFNDLDELMRALQAMLPSGATVLVKGSRFMQMERVVQQLTNEITGVTH